MWLLPLGPSFVIPPSVVRTSILGDASVRRGSRAMAPKPGVNLFRYALCMITTGVFDVKSNIPPAWRPNLRQPFTAYAISSFFYTAVGIALCGTQPPRQLRPRRPSARPASARSSSGRPPASPPRLIGRYRRPSLQPSSLGLGLPRGHRTPRDAHRHPPLGTIAPTDAAAVTVSQGSSRFARSTCVRWRRRPVGL